MTTTTIVGNITREPELRFTASGQALANLTIVVSRKWNDKITNEAKEQASFFDITAWGTLAESVAESLTKGDRVIAVGRLEQQTWETDGNKRSKIILVAEDIGPSCRWATAVVTRAERTSVTSVEDGAPF